MVVRLIIMVVVGVEVRINGEEIRFVALANISSAYHAHPDFQLKFREKWAVKGKANIERNIIFLIGGWNTSVQTRPSGAH